MRIRRREGGVSIEAPAKLNLFLEILGKRSDGYHDLETIMVPIAVRDELRLTLRDDDRVTLDCRWIDAAKRRTSRSEADLTNPPDDAFPPVESNLCYRGAELFRRHFGIERGVHIDLRKRIPMQAGMGGGSSDAAAALLGCAALFDRELSRDEALELAAQLGSDVPFFIDSVPCVARGRGERLEALDSDERHMLSRMRFVIAKPPEGVSTREAFAASEGGGPRHSADAFRRALRRGNRDELAAAAFNRLDGAARRLVGAVQQTAERFERDARVHALTGSGSARFAMHRDEATARRHLQRLRTNYEGWTELARPWTPANRVVSRS